MCSMVCTLSPGHRQRVEAPLTTARNQRRERPALSEHPSCPPFHTMFISQAVVKTFALQRKQRSVFVVRRAL